MTGRTYVFAGGGTGGHLFPGVAVAERLVEQHPDARIVFVGTDRAIEREILARTPFEHRIVMTAKGGRLQSARQAWRSYHASLAILHEARPAVVVGCGGGASVATVVAARTLRLPVLLLEQNVIPGRATRLLSRLDTTVCLTYQESAACLPQKTRFAVTGNPVRRAIGDLATDALANWDPVERKILLVLGGSQGARDLNDAVLNFMRQHPTLLNGWRIVHQTGQRDVDRIRGAYASLGIDAQVAAFLEDMAPLFRESGLVISRAGGTTLSELACAGVPAILVPYPNAKDDHQLANAQVFQNVGAAALVEQTADDDWKVMFGDTVANALKHDSGRKLSANLMNKLARPGAAGEVVRLLEESSGVT